MVFQSTGLTGLVVAANPHHTLGALYGKILRTLQKMPDESMYKKYTEQIVRERAAILKVVRLAIYHTYYMDLTYRNRQSGIWPLYIQQPVKLCIFLILINSIIT